MGCERVAENGSFLESMEPSQNVHNWVECSPAATRPTVAVGRPHSRSLKPTWSSSPTNSRFKGGAARPASYFPQSQSDDRPCQISSPSRSCHDRPSASGTVRWCWLPRTWSLHLKTHQFQKSLDSVPSRPAAAQMMAAANWARTQSLPAPWRLLPRRAFLGSSDIEGSCTLYQPA